jgi:hypothetical protein
VSPGRSVGFLCPPHGSTAPKTYEPCTKRARGKVYEHVVDPGVLEGDPRVAWRVEDGLQPLLAPRDLLLDHLHGQPALALRALQHPAQLADLRLLVDSFGFWGYGQARERRAGHHDRVPVVGGDAGDELAALLRRRAREGALEAVV